MTLREILSEEELERFESFLEEFRRLNDEMPVIVEGRHDRDALRALGLRGEIIVLNVGMNLVDFADSTASRYREVILLFDWDEAGDRLTARLASLLNSLGVNTHLEVRESIRRLVPHISTVEELVF